MGKWYDVKEVSVSANFFKIADNQLSSFRVGGRVRVRNAGENSGIYVVIAMSFISNNTRIFVRKLVRYDSVDEGQICMYRLRPIRRKRKRRV
jgi:hypothetical protein